MTMRIVYLAFGVLSPTRAHNVQTTRTVEALADAGVDVVFVNPRWSESADDLGVPHAPPRVRSVLLPRSELYSAYRKRWLRGRYWALFADRSLFALRAVGTVRRERPDAIITRDIVACAWMNLLAPCPVVYEAHSYEQILFGAVFDRTRATTSSRTSDFSLDQYDPSVIGRAFLGVLSRVEDWAIGRAARVITLTDAFADVLERRLGIARPIVIPSGHDVADAPVDKAALRTRLDLPRDQRIALYAGLTFGGKSPSYLLEVARQLPPGFTIVIVGGTPSEHAELAAEAARTNARVMIRPRVPHAEALAYMQASDLGLLVYPEHPSLGVHASPLKAVEYLAAGVPLVATDSPSARELVEHGVNGWLVPRDAPTIARTIVATFDDEAALSRMREAAARSVRGRDYKTRGRRIAEAVRGITSRRTNG